MNLNQFEFDFDLTWVGFFVNANGTIYGRYGGRDASGPDEKISLKGLRFALETALAKHKNNPNAKPMQLLPMKLAENFPAAKRLNKNTCIHCHQVYEFQRDRDKSKGTWTRDSVWRFPPPERVGITLDTDRGNLIKAILPKSPAAKLGIRPGDTLVSVNKNPVASYLDAQYGLHKAPLAGKIPVSWARNKQQFQGQLTLPKGWKRHNITWRPSLFDLLPSMPLFGEDLTAAEKAKYKLRPDQLAFRLGNDMLNAAKEAGFQGGDIVVGVDDEALDMSMIDFLGYSRRNYMVGDRLIIRIIRDGKKRDVPLTLK